MLHLELCQAVSRGHRALPCARIHSFIPSLTACCRLPPVRRTHVCVQMEKTVAERQKLRRACEAQGWDDDATEGAVRLLTEQRFQQGKDTQCGCEEHYAEMGGTCYYMLRLFYHLTQICTQDQLVTFIHEGELIHKLRGCRTHQEGVVVYGTETTPEFLSQVWTDKARGLSREYYKQIEGEAAAVQDSYLTIPSAGSDAAARAGLCHFTQLTEWERHMWLGH